MSSHECKEEIGIVGHSLVTSIANHKGSQRAMKLLDHGKCEFFAHEFERLRQLQLSPLLRIRARLSSLSSALLLLSSCSSTSPPLSIKMYNPQTTQTLTCSASDQLSRAELPLLAVAVETCAKQLEGKGFVRQR
jgi:hypothetical protein